MYNKCNAPSAPEPLPSNLLQLRLLVLFTTDLSSSFEEICRKI